MRLFITALLALLPVLSHAVAPSRPIQECAEHLPYGQPKSAKTDTTLVCRAGYALEHDNRAKIPAWVAYTITPQRALGCAAREEGFEPEPAVPAGKRAELKDYAKSGYDIGHMANSADMRWSVQASDDSNVLSNAAPQLPGLNRAAWKSLEVRVRTWVLGRGHPILVYVGPIYDAKGASTIGPNQVVVPKAFYKVLVDQQTKEVMAFIYPHEASRDNPAAFRTSLAEVQKQAGFVLPVPKGVISSRGIWAVSASSIKAKAAACPTQ